MTDRDTTDLDTTDRDTTDLGRAAHGVLLAGFTGPDVPDWLPMAYRQGLAGVCLYGNNVAPGRDLVRLARQVRALDPAAVLAVDEEGGDVTRMHAGTGSPYAGAAALGRYDDVAATRAVAAAIGRELAGAGIWLDLAPCADVNSDPRNPVIGTRSFGADPQLVARHAVAFAEGLATAGVAAAVKHFPGHGDTHADSHLSLPNVTAAREVLDARELVPFRAAVAAGVPAVMTSHVVLTAIDAGQPATLSHAVLTGLLRDELGYRGVIVTDALDMAGASAMHGTGGAAVRALRAGADLLCLGPGTAIGPAQVETTVRALLEAVADGTLPPERLVRAARRVTELRRTWASREPGRDAVQERHDDGAVVAAGRAASRQVATAVVGTVPAMPGAAVIHVERQANAAVGETAWGLPSLGGPVLRRSGSDLPGSPLPAGPVVLVVRGATVDEDVWSWVRAVLASNSQAWLVELGWPDPQLDGLDRVVRTWGSAGVLTEALSRALRGRS